MCYRLVSFYLLSRVHHIREEADVYLTSVFLLPQEDSVMDTSLYGPEISPPNAVTGLCFYHEIWGIERVHRWRTGCVQTTALLAPVFCFNQTKMCLVPIFSSLSASSYFPAQLEVFPLPLNLTPFFSSLPQWLRSHIWFC